MKITNQSGYKTQDLRKLFIACYKMIDVSFGSREIQVVVESSQTKVNGQVFLSTPDIWIQIPPPNMVAKEDALLIRTVAWVFIHELMHCEGLEHKNMGDWWHPYRKEKLRHVSWADGFRLRPRKATKH